MKLSKQTVTFSLPYLMFLLLMGCISGAPSPKQEFNAYQELIPKQIALLQKSIVDNKLNNAVLLKHYASELKELNPKFESIAEDFLTLTRPDNAVIAEFQTRFDQIIQDYENKNRSLNNTLIDLKHLAKASHPEIYNDSLIDEINTLANLSNGHLTAIHTDNNAHQNPGQHLVGNPKYGQWVSDGSTSIWAWYGIYRLFSDLHAPYRYHSWYYNRPWSYYQDYGRDFYENKYQRTVRENNHRQNSQSVKQYGQRTGRFASEYERPRSNPKFKPSSASRSARFSSSFQSDSRSKGYRGSHRSGSRSRGHYGGK